MTGCLSELPLPERAPVPEDFRNSSGSIPFPFSETYPVHNLNLPLNSYIQDLDGDGVADVMQNNGWIDYIADDVADTLLPWGWKKTEETRPMTPEIRQAATEVMQVDRNLIYLVVNDRYQFELAERVRNDSTN